MVPLLQVAETNKLLDVFTAATRFKRAEIHLYPENVAANVE